MRKFVATFQSPEALLKGIRKVKGEGFSATDAITPFRLEEIESLLDVKKPPIRAIMAAAGFLAAGFAYWLEWFSAVIDYPINSGGRPLNSWPVFLLVPFEFGVLCAGIAGFVSLLVFCGMPSLCHPIFAVNGIERATCDRFFLVVGAGADENRDQRLKEVLQAEGATTIEELAE